VLFGSVEFLPALKNMFFRIKLIAGQHVDVNLVKPTPYYRNSMRI